MKDIMVKIRRYLYEKFEEPGQVELHFKELFKIFSGRVSVLLQEIIRLSKWLGLRFDMQQFLKDNPPEKGIPTVNLSQHELNQATEALINQTLFDGLSTGNCTNITSFIHQQDKAYNLSIYLNYLYVDILPKEEVSQEKSAFFQYVQSYLKGHTPDYKLPYTKQKEDFKREITDLAKHLRAKPFFFDITCYSNRTYTPFHTLVGLEEEAEIKIHQLDRYGAIITPLKPVQTIQQVLVIIYHRQERTLEINKQVIKLPGIITHHLLATLLAHNQADQQMYISEVDIYEDWGYDLNEVLEASQKLRAYHAARKINQTIALKLGISDTIQERKGFASFRINPNLTIISK